MACQATPSPSTLSQILSSPSSTRETFEESNSAQQQVNHRIYNILPRKRVAELEKELNTRTEKSISSDAFYDLLLSQACDSDGQIHKDEVRKEVNQHLERSQRLLQEEKIELVYNSPVVCLDDQEWDVSLDLSDTSMEGRDNALRNLLRYVRETRYHPTRPSPTSPPCAPAISSLREGPRLSARTSPKPQNPKSKRVEGARIRKKRPMTTEKGSFKTRSGRTIKKPRRLGFEA